MALIKCPECRKKVSDQCENCPQCGYPVKSFLENRALDNGSNEPVEMATAIKKPLYKKVWFWLVIGAVLAAFILGTLFFLNRDTKPRLDEKGHPIFVELTGEVYTNAKDYLGYYVKISGKVFQILGDNGNGNRVQVWIDPDSCEQNLMIQYTNDVQLSEGDYIVCTGYIDSVKAYKNAFDTELEAPLIISGDLRKATYDEVMAPAKEIFVLDNQKQTQRGYTVSIDKVEFAEKETRVWVTVTNNGTDTLCIGDAVILQDGNQFNESTNYDADYEVIPYEIVTGATCTGVIVFPQISSDTFKLTINAYASNLSEDIDNFVFEITRQDDATQTPDNDEPMQPTTSSTEPSSSTDTEDKSQNQLAVEAAEEISGTYATVYPNMVKELLQEDYGFSYSQAIYGVNHAQIDWNFYACKHLEDYVRNHYGERIIKNDIENALSYDYGYSQEAIEYAFANTNVDWDSNYQKMNEGKIPTEASAVGTYDCDGFVLYLFEDGTLIEIDLEGTVWEEGVWTQTGSEMTLEMQSTWFGDTRIVKTRLNTDGFVVGGGYYLRIE